MKVLLFAAFVTYCALSLSQTIPAPVIDETVKKCLAQSNLPQTYLMDFINGVIKPTEASANLKCFVRCHMEARGLMKNGDIMEENIVKAAENITSVTQFRKIIAACKLVKGKEPCETSFNVFMCIVDELY